MLMKFLKIIISIIVQRQVFFLWLKVKDGENFTKQLYSKYAIKVMPGEYLAYGKNNNPGKEYVRIALVHTQIKNNKGLNKIAKLLL